MELFKSDGSSLAGAHTASFASGKVHVGGKSYSFQVAHTGNPTGTFTVEASNTGHASDWSAVDTLEDDASASTNTHLGEVGPAPYAFVRLVYTHSAGTLTVARSVVEVF